MTEIDHPPAAAGAAQPSLVEPDEIRWKTTPIDKYGFGLIAAAFAVATAVYTLVGLAIVEWWDTSAAGEADLDVNEWLEDRRTDGWNRAAEIISHSGDTIAKVIAGVILIPVFLWLFRRWHEYALVVGGMLLEVCIFGLSSELVGRERPSVERLDDSPTNSFPSGHIAAAAVYYCGISVVFFMRTRKPGLRAVGVAVGVIGTGSMIFARVYQGMHYVTDAIGSLVLAAIVLAVMWKVVHRTLPDDESPDAHDLAAGRSS